MKKLQNILNCLTGLIRKKFFNRTKSDFHQNYNDMPVISSFIADTTENDVKEYLENYTLTTRWQTL